MSSEKHIVSKDNTENTGPKVETQYKKVKTTEIKWS